jgi:hypothetical protein
MDNIRYPLGAGQRVGDHRPMALRHVALETHQCHAVLRYQSTQLAKRPLAAAVAMFWRYVRIQLMVFIFGCVGPIFWGIYFATQPDPTMKWAYWAGLFITAGDVLIALALTGASDPFSSTAPTFSTDSGPSSRDYSPSSD